MPSVVQNNQTEKPKQGRQQHRTINQEEAKQCHLPHREINQGKTRSAAQENQPIYQNLLIYGGKLGWQHFFILLIIYLLETVISSESGDAYIYIYMKKEMSLQGVPKFLDQLLDEAL